MASVARVGADRGATAGEIEQAGGSADEAQLQIRNRDVPTDHS